MWWQLAHLGVAVVGGVVACLLGGPVVQWTFRRADPPRADDDRMIHLMAAGQQLRGGVWIGRLERLAVFATLMCGYPAGIAVIVAVKALARYPELKSTTTGAAERFIIGTFVSVLWAAAWAGVAMWVNTLL